MRIYRRASAALTRSLRTTREADTNVIRTSVPRVSVQFDRGATNSLSTSTGSAFQPKPELSISPDAGKRFRGTDASPAITVVQTLVDWNQHIDYCQSTEIRSAPLDQATTTVRRELNQTLRVALERGDFPGALTALHALIGLSRELRGHPVDTENYNRLLYQWSQHVARRKRDHQQQRTPIALTPILALLESMVAWKRVNTRSFNTALVACHKMEALDACERVVELMKQSGRVNIGAFAYTNLISCCARVASKHRGRQSHFVRLAEQFLEDFLASGAKTTIEVVNATVFAYRAVQGRSGDAVVLVERALHEWKLELDSSTVSTLVVCLLKDKNALEASQWIEYALRQRIVVDDAILRSVVDACRRQAAWSQVESLRQLLQEHGIAQQDRELKQVFKQSRQRDPKSASPSTVLYGKKRAGAVGKKHLKSGAAILVRDAIRSLESGQSIQLPKGQWIDMFTHGKVADLDELMRLLLASNSQERPDKVRQAWVNQLYLGALGAASQWWRVVDTVDILLEHTPDDVDIDCFNAAIRSCAKAGRLGEAVHVLERMENKKVRPNRESYDALMQCCGTIGSVEGAMQYFREIERMGFEPTSHDLNAVLKAHANVVQRLIDAGHVQANDVDVPASDLTKLGVHALQFFDEVTSHYQELRPTESSLFYLFRSFLGAAEMIDEIDFREFEAFVQHNGGDAYAPKADWILLSDVIQEICRSAPLEAVSPRVVNVGIDFFHRRSESDRAFELFNTMISRQITPTADSIRLLFGACCNGDDDVQAGLLFLDHLLGELSDKQSTLSQATAKEALRWAGQITSNDVGSSRPGLVDTVLDKLTSTGALTMDAAMFEQVVAVFALEGNIAQAKRLAQRMLMETGTVSLSVANRVLQACSVARAPQVALDSLGWMERHGVEPDVVSYNNVLSAIRRQRAEPPHSEQEEDFEDDEESDKQADDNLEQEGYDGEQHSAQGRRTARARVNPLNADLNAVIDALLTTMDERGVHADAKIFENASQIASKRQEMARLLSLFDKIKTCAAQRHVALSALLTEKTMLQYLDACAAVATVDSTEIAGRVEELRAQLALWHRERGYKVTAVTLQRILHVYDALNEWRDAIAILKHASEVYGVTPNVELFHTVMATANRVGQHKAVEQIFVTMQKPGLTGRVVPTAACYVEAILASEQQGDWIQATQLFMEMQKKCAAEDLHPALLHRIALGRYAEGRKRLD